MNILYISMLNGKKSSGVSYSIPAQIMSQSQIDNVFWYNINHISKELIINGAYCKNLNDFPDLKISSLPKPFDKPDLVVFEELYYFPYIKLGLECRKNNIPYIIIPRSSLTTYAQKKKFLKKKLANFFLFKKFINNATAIQYLTQNEFETSGNKWNKKHLIISNGIEKKENIKTQFNMNNLKGVYIGRLDTYQKGLDILIESCHLLVNKLKKEKCLIEIYGPDKHGERRKLQNMIDKMDLNDIVTLKEPVFDKEKEKVLINSDFFILTSRFEGHPMGLIEALSYGLPCLVTEGTNMAKEIQDANAGWVSEDVTSESLAATLEKMLNESRTLEIKSKNALKLSENYNWDILAKESHEYYSQLLVKQGGK